MTANGWASAARHRLDQQPSKLMLNFGSWAGRLHAVLGAVCGTSALLADHRPNLQSNNRARIRLSAVYPLTAFIRLHAVLGGWPNPEAAALRISTELRIRS